MKQNKDGGERIKLLPQTAWSDYFFFQNMQAHICFATCRQCPLACVFRRQPEAWMQTYFAGMKWGRLSEKSQKEKWAIALPIRACLEKAVVGQNRANFSAIRRENGPKWSFRTAGGIYNRRQGRGIKKGRRAVPFSPSIMPDAALSGQICGIWPCEACRHPCRGAFSGPPRTQCSCRQRTLHGSRLQRT